jgi:hypothetical protein
VDDVALAGGDDEREQADVWWTLRGGGRVDAKDVKRSGV